MIHLASNLAGDGSLSMHLYRDDLLTAFEQIGFTEFMTLVPPSGIDCGRIRLQWDRYVSFPLMVHRELQQGDVLHVLDHSNGHLCRLNQKSVVTCHDIAEYRISQLRAYQLKLWKNRVESIRNAAVVVAISENTKRDLEELLGIPGERVIVNYCGRDASFTPDPSVRESTLNRLGLADAAKSGTFFLLHVGSNILRKNMTTLIKAMEILSSEGMDIKLIKVGDPLMASDHAKLIHEAGIADRISDVGTQSLSELQDIYRSVDVFCFPSTYEGFGRPVLEAQGSGCPVILAESSCLREVAGDACLYHDPLDAAALAEQISILHGDATLAESLRSRGLANVQRFSWERHASAFVDLYKSI
jgi:glycosyltransferase involved in cell wall biosynthesis